ncbi:unnamed protein product [Rhizoctonia solani]|uniref:Ricin B lectin domain-containing protein n=1 Tax=Rhizoctonia solani TaxID=456999 RepID=A0A8H3BGX9_9AGAM|nr:unnamed protein product [Rhizoctonia solani]
MTIEPGKYQIKNHASWTTLDESTDGEQVIHGWTQTNESNQHWEVHLEDDGNYVIQNIASGSFLFADGPEDGTRLVGSGNRAAWYLDQHSEGWVYISFPGTNQVVDLDNGEAADGTTISLWRRNDDSKQQQWFFEPV